MEHVFTGVLPHGYQGHVAYSTKLPEGLARLSVTLALDRLEPLHAPPPDAWDTKNEIHLEAFLSGAFLGGLHAQAAVRTLAWEVGAPAEAAPRGCLPVSSLCGVLTVQMPVFNVLDGVGYTLRIQGE